MSLDSIIARGRTAAIMRMRDQGQVVRPGPLSAPDAGTGVVTPTETVIYTGKGRVRPQTRVTSGGVDAGEARLSNSVYIVGVPHTALGIRAGDVWVTTASTDPEVLALRLRIVNIADSAQTTERRLICELIQARKP